MSVVKRVLSSREFKHDTKLFVGTVGAALIAVVSANGTIDRAVIIAALVAGGRRVLKRLARKYAS